MRYGGPPTSAILVLPQIPFKSLNEIAEIISPKTLLTLF